MPRFEQSARAARRQRAEKKRPIETGMRVVWDQSDRSYGELTGGLTPRQVSRVMEMAVTGACRDQYKLCQEIAEKDDAILTALQTRAGKVAGTTWRIEPADESRKAKRIAEEVDAMLRRPSPTRKLLSFRQYLKWSISTSLLPNFSAAELRWSEGLTRLAFRPVEAHYFTYLNSEEPLFVPTAGEYKPLDYGRWIVHHPMPGRDPARGGLIRPLAWMFIFRNFNLKDWMRFGEKYGMPFLLAKISEQGWDKERRQIAYAIRNFGSDGGAVFTDAVDLQPVAASTAHGELYLGNHKHWDAAETRLILGQTSTTSSEDSNRSTADVHDDVRHDLLEDDCATLSETTGRDVIAPYVQWHHGPAAPCPCLVFETEPPEDLDSKADVVSKLYLSGHKAKASWVEETFGVELQEVPGPGLPAGRGRGVTSDEAPSDELPAGRGGGSPQGPAGPTGDAVLEAETDPAGAEDLTASARAEFLQGEGLEQWLGPVRRAVEVLLAQETEAGMRQAAAALREQLTEIYGAMDSTTLEGLIERVRYAAAANATAERAAELAAKEGGAHA